jgi:hypothetical protein
MEMERRRIELDALLRLLKSAVGEILRLQEGDAFLSWMQSEAPKRFPEVFSGLDERVVRALTLELGRQIWDATPLPRNAFHPLPLPRPRDQDPCPCGSGRPYGDCCTAAPAVPGLNPELVWALVVGELTLEEAASLAESGGVPRPYLGIVARRLVETGQQERAVALLEPLFEDPELLQSGDADALSALLDSYETLGRSRELRSFIDRFAEVVLRGDEAGRREIGGADPGDN